MKGPKPGVRWRGSTTLVLVVVLLVGLLTRADPKQPVFPPTDPQVLHPVVTDGSDYLNNGYANGAHVLDLPGILLGMSADGTIAATRSADGIIKGYRLSDGQVSWVAGDAGIPTAFVCGAENDRYSAVSWSERGLALCWPTDAPSSYLVINLANGALTELGDLSRYTSLRFVGFEGTSVIVAVVTPLERRVRLVRLGPGGRELYSAVVYERAVGEELDLLAYMRSTLTEHRVFLSVKDSEPMVFDARTGALVARLEGQPNIDGPRVTADGYWDGALYDASGAPLGVPDRCDLLPRSGVLFPGADYQAQTGECKFKLVGPSGRVFAECHYRDRCLLNQAGVRVAGYPELPSAWGFLTRDESTVVLLSNSIMDARVGVRLYDAHTGDLIASFPLAWAWAESGIIHWTGQTPYPDDRLRTQILIPGP